MGRVMDWRGNLKFEDFYRDEKGVINTFEINIRSLRQNFYELMVYLVQVIDKLHIIILSDIWTQDNEVVLYQLVGFKQFYMVREFNKSGGVMIYVREGSFDFTEEKVNMKTAEAILIKDIKLQFAILFIYRVQFMEINEFNKELEAQIRGMKFRYFFVTGDINIDIFQSKNEIDEYMNILSEHDLRPFINFPTRVNITRDSCLDHVFARFNEVVEMDTAVVEGYITDHYPILIRIRKFDNKFKQIEN